MNVLLVEPSYKNKYPPLGLMKISTYHKSRGDEVVFYKGNMPRQLFDKYHFERVYITSLFTFYYDVTLKAIIHYKRLISSVDIFIGGILASLMTDKLACDIGNEINIIAGLLTDSNLLGFCDKVNIDSLPLDYSILDQIEYKYPAGDNYFAYISRGCTNKCKFCAVPILEPEFRLTNNIIHQIEVIKRDFGEKQNLLLLDNNILSFSAEELSEIVDDIRTLGFDGVSKFTPELPFSVFIKKLSKTNSNTPIFQKTLKALIDYLNKQCVSRMSKTYAQKYISILFEINQADDKYAIILKEEPILFEILSFYYNSSGRKRCVDFNQGIDARQLTEEKMQILSRIPVSPFRLAYDNIKFTSIYERAMTIAAQHGVKSFSNYMLYNFDDEPVELWDRLKINIELAKRLNVQIFSFPMKYAPIDLTDRLYIGTHWNKRYLSNVYAILNVTKGIVADGEEFFYRAFGHNHEEFLQLLAMPRNFVIFRNTYENNGLARSWREKYLCLTPDERSELLNVLDGKISAATGKVSDILEFYH